MLAVRLRSGFLRGISCFARGILSFRLQGLRFGVRLATLRIAAAGFLAGILQRNSVRLGAVIRFIRDADELQRQIELEAVSIATALVSLLYMAGGFLQLAKVIDVPSGVAMIWLFPLVCVCYGLVKVVVARRYQ